MSNGTRIGSAAFPFAACAAMSSVSGPAAGAGAARAAGSAGAAHGAGWSGAWRHGSHWHGAYGASVGIYLGPGIYWGWPYDPYAYDAWPYDVAYGSPYSYVYLYPHVTLAYPTDAGRDAMPAPAAAPEPPAFRYYCSDPKGYYPQVATCARPWLRVLPSDAQPAPGVPGAPSGE